MGKMILNVTIAVIFSTGWVFPLWASFEYSIQAMLQTPFEKVNGVELHILVRQTTMMAMFWMAFVAAGWSGYLAYKFFPAPQDDEE